MKMSKFQVGDRVKVSPARFGVELVGTVLECRKYTVMVKHDGPVNGMHDCYGGTLSDGSRDKWAHLLNQVTKMESKPKFKIGDRVLVSKMSDIGKELRGTVLSCGEHCAIVKHDRPTGKMHDCFGGQFSDGVPDKFTHSLCFLKKITDEFKVGDRVLGTDRDWKDAPGTIVAVYPFLILVKHDSPHLFMHAASHDPDYKTDGIEDKWFYPPSKLKRAKMKKSKMNSTGMIEDVTYILIVHENGGLAPSERPKTYSTENQALRVAGIMSAKSPGLKFYVFKAVAVAETVANPKPPVRITKL
jgi:hypothetical protein